MTFSADRRPAKRLRALIAPLRIFIRDHDDRVADLELRMRDAAIWHGEAVKLLCSEDLLIEIRSPPWRH